MLENLITTYGYPAILVGTFFEGETIVLLAGYLSNRGYLVLEWAIVFAVLGSWSGDTLYFFIGRKWGDKLLDKRPAWRPAADRALELLRRYDAIFILSFRFLYGLRTVSPFVIGMSKVPTWRFILLNFIASVIWATAFCTGGYLLGTMLESVVAEVEQYEAYVLLGIILLGFVAWLVHMRFIRHRRPRSTAGASAPAAESKDGQSERHRDAP